MSNGLLLMAPLTLSGSMNSLLDNNKVFCLPNNERIALAPKVLVVFEVDDLLQASPATFSRCEIIIFDPG